VLIRKEHYAELTHDHVKLTIGKRQIKGISLLPADALAANIGLSERNHRLIEISGRNSGLWGQGARQFAGYHAGTGRRLQHTPR
jgi:hypothetical protein